MEINENMYFDFCNMFDKVASGTMEAADLEEKLKTLPEGFFEAFCDANDFVNANNVREAVEEYKEQIREGERK